MTLVFGIESTAHTFSCGIVSDVHKHCNVLSNEKHSLQTREGGMIPRELGAHHQEYAKSVVDSALKKSGKAIEEMDVFAFAQGPGMGPALRVGALTARALALKYNKPLLGVNHAVAHIEIGKALTNARDPLVVYISGGNTQLIGLEEGHYRVFGETLDIGIGNLLDSFGRALGRGFPAGPALDEKYFLGKQLIELPYTVKGMDLAYSGLLTAAEQKIGKMQDSSSSGPLKAVHRHAQSKARNENDLCYSLFHTAAAMLTEVTERALAHTGKKEVLLVGGVAASKAVQGMMQKMGDARGAKLFVPPLWACGDQGAMIAWTGLLAFRAGVRQRIEDTNIKQRFRVDEVKAVWAKPKKSK